MYSYRSAIVLSFLVLSACGGSNGPDTTDPIDPNPPTTTVDTSAITKVDSDSGLPADWQTSGAFMEIFVRGFNDSNGDGIGDLKGVTAKLDYLQDLGIKGIWLMPITKSYDKDHGYSVVDYRDIEPQYGTLADFDELIDEAHKRGIGVIMDYVINHSAATNPLFLDAKSDANAYYRNWYIWSDSKPTGWPEIYTKYPWYETSHGYYFSAFWDQMPDLNLRNPEVVAYQNNNLRFWLNRKVDGFRFDAVGHLFENGKDKWENQPENHPFLKNVQTLVNGYSKRYMVCEGPSSSYWEYADSNSCGSAFAFGLYRAMVASAKGTSDAIFYVDDYLKWIPGHYATLLANHDSFTGRRIYDQLNGDIAAYKMAAATYLTAPGIPFIYYGEEIGMAGATGLNGMGDLEIRGPLSWTANTSNAGFSSSNTLYRAVATNVATFNVAAEQADSNSLLNFYKALLNLRNTHAALAKGSYEFSAVNGKTLSFQRRSGNDRILVVLNYDTSPSSITVTNLPNSTSLTPLYPAGLAAAGSNASGQLTLTPAAQSVSIYQF